jgi:hypothetical protein
MLKFTDLFAILGIWLGLLHICYAPYKPILYHCEPRMNNYSLAEKKNYRVPNSYVCVTPGKGKERMEGTLEVHSVVVQGRQWSMYHDGVTWFSQ